ncbi:MAG: hypothetical protein RLY50_297, partial [Actinomycetota bacterium]
MISLTVVAVEFAEILPWLAVVVAVLGVGVVVAPRLRRGAPTVPVETARREPAAVTPEPDMSAPANVEPTVAEPEQVEEETLDLLAVETEHIVEQR